MNTENELKKISEKIQKEFISLNKYKYNDLILENINWNFVQFYSELIYQADVKEIFDKIELEKFHKKYEKDRNININLSDLFDKQWIRVINGEVRIPSVVEYTVNYMDKIKSKEDEQSLLFLKAFFDKIGYRSEQRLIIEKEQFNKLLNNHKIVYPKCPDINFFIQKNIIIDNTSEFELTVFKLFNHNSMYNFNDMIAAIVWQKILDDNTFVDDNDRLKKWISKVVYFCYPSKVSEFLPYESLKKLIEPAYLFLINEDDLIDNGSEIKKLIWDYYAARDLFDYNLNDRKINLVSNYDYFELYRSLTNINRRPNSDILSYQKIRIIYSLLINILIHNENNKIDYIKKLLNESLNKPYLLWETINLIKRERPELIPFLLSEIKYSSLFLNIILELDEINVNVNENVLTEIWCNSFKIYLDHILHVTDEAKNIPRDIIKILLPIVYNIYYGYSNKKNILIERYDKGLEILKDIYLFDKNLFPNMVSGIFEEFKKLNDDLYKIDEGRFSFFKYDFLINILKLLFNFKIEEKNDINELIHIENIEKNISKYILEFYKKEINNKDRWYGNLPDIKLIHWEYWIIVLYKNSHLFDFASYIHSIVKFENNDFYNEKNQNIAEAIRLHLKILLDCYSSIKENQNQIFYYESTNLLNDLENFITNLLSNFIYNDLENNKIDIFDHLFESIISDKKNELLPLTIEILNYFNDFNRNNIMKIFIDKDLPLDRYLKIYNMLVNENDKKNLKSEIESKDINKFLNEVNYLPDLETALINSLNSDLSIEMANKILEYLNNVLNNKKSIDHLFKEKIINLYFFRLALYYKDKNREELEKSTIPEEITNDVLNKTKFIYIKSFYLALLDIDNRDFLFAINKLNHLIKVDRLNYQYKIYLLYTEILQAKIISDKKNQIVECLRIIEKSNSYLNEITNKSEVNFNLIYYIQMECYLIMKKYSEIDNIYYNLFNSFDRKFIDVTDVMIKSLIERENYTHVREIINKIIINDENKEKINEWNKLLSNENNIKNLSQKFKDILFLPDNDRFKIIPEKLNKHNNDLSDFFMNEIAYSMINILEKIKSIVNIEKKDSKKNVETKIKNIDEDSFTDLIQIQLNARLFLIDYKFNDHVHKGSSKSGKTTGKPDLSIKMGLNDIIIESIRVKNYGAYKSDLIEHILKSFDYSVSKNIFYDLIYYQKDDFQNDWEIIKKIVSEVKYPNDYKFISNEEINFDNNSIKVIKNQHENGLVFYHIMADLNYCN